jgi:hypothetical protein
MFHPTVSAIIIQYYKNINGKTDKTKEEASPSSVLHFIFFVISPFDDQNC